MPNYYNPYLYNAPGAGVPTYTNPYLPQPVGYSATSSYGAPSGNYWISVDGEMAARAWQMPPNLPPNTIIPLWDLDGQHVYFKSTDAYGRINPIRKGRVLFDDDSQNLPQGASEASVNTPSGTNYVGDSGATGSAKYVTKEDLKEDLEGLKREIQDMFRQNQSNATAIQPSYAQNDANANQSKWKQNRGDSK